MNRLKRPLLALLAGALAGGCPAPRPPPPARSPVATAPVPAAPPVAERILAHEDRRDADDGVLEGLLADPAPALRRRAALALGRIGEPRSIPALARLLADPEPTVRAMAAFALGEVARPEIVPMLVGALADADAGVRFHVLEALTKAPTKEGAVAAFAALRAERDATTLSAAITYSFRFPDPALLPLLLEYASVAAVDVRRAAIYALVRADVGAIQEKDPAVLDDARKQAYVAAMVRAAADTDDFTASMAARGLGRLRDVTVAGREEALRELLGRSDLSVRVEALRGYGAFYAGTGVIWHEARDAALSPQSSLRSAAFEALAAVGGPEAEEILRRALRASDGHDREVAMTMLFRMGPSYMDRDLAALLEDGAWQVRAALAAALGGEGIEYGERELARLLDDPDERVRPFALATMAGRKLPGNEQELRAALLGSDAILAATAADEISKRADARAFSDELRRAFESHRADRENDARVAVLDAFARADMTVELSAALEDPDWVVRRKAAALLEAADGSYHPVAPRSPDRDPADYARALDSSNPRTVTVATARGSFRIELDWEAAPLTCLNFVTLVKGGFYDGLAYHRIVPGFVVQDGCPRGDGNGGPGHRIRCEINERRYGKGVVGMALAGKDTGGSQYFVTLAPTPHLDGGYTVFGRVAAGMEVVESLAQGDRTLRMTVP